MASTDDLLNSLDRALHSVFAELEKSRNLNKKLSGEIQVLESELEESQKTVKALENKNKEIKVASALSGSTEHKRLMKHKLNSLVKDIDLCIAGVKKRSI